MSIHIPQTFNRIENVPKIQKIEDAQRVVDNLVRQFNTVVGQLNSMKEAIQRGQSTGDTTITINNSIGGGSGGGSSGSTLQYRAQSVALVGGVATPVLFSSAFSVSFVLSSLRCYNTDGQAIGFDISSLTVTGFTVTAMEDATLIYQAVEAV